MLLPLSIAVVGKKRLLLLLLQLIAAKEGRALCKKNTMQYLENEFYSYI